jgi:hypothetical protein
MGQWHSAGAINEPVQNHCLQIGATNDEVIILSLHLIIRNHLRLSNPRRHAAPNPSSLAPGFRRWQKLRNAFPADRSVAVVLLTNHQRRLQADLAGQTGTTETIL